MKSNGESMLLPDQFCTNRYPRYAFRQCIGVVIHRPNAGMTGWALSRNRLGHLSLWAGEGQNREVGKV
jgi:hypothetical protein